MMGNIFGVGRDDGKEKGEYAAIFYNKEKYKKNVRRMRNLEENFVKRIYKILISLGWSIFKVFYRFLSLRCKGHPHPDPLPSRERKL
mgnify:CR=1 FL=1